MAIVIRARFKPLVNRDPQQTMIERFDAAAGTGTVVLPVQIVAYDDATYNPATAVPGDPQQEAWLDVLYEDVVRLDLAALAGRTQAQVNAALAAALDGWSVSLKSAGPGVLKIWRAARQVGLRTIP